MLSLVGAAHAPDVAVFAVGAVLVILGALGVVLMRNPVHSALSLVTTLFGVAVLFVEQEAHFLAAVQVIVYAGAIVVLFLFVIMLLGVDRVDRMRRDPIPGQRVLALVLGLGIAVLAAILVAGKWNGTGAASQGGKASGAGSNVQKLADSIFTQYLFAFEATSVLLVIAVVGAVVLARRPEGPTSDDEDDDGPVLLLPGDEADHASTDAVGEPVDDELVASADDEELEVTGK